MYKSYVPIPSTYFGHNGKRKKWSAKQNTRESLQPSERGSINPITENYNSNWDKCHQRNMPTTIEDNTGGFTLNR